MFFSTLRHQHCNFAVQAASERPIGVVFFSPQLLHFTRQQQLHAWGVSDLLLVGPGY